MTSNTVGYKNKSCNVGTSVADSTIAVEPKKDSLPVNHSVESVDCTSGKENSVTENKGNPTKTGEGEYISIDSNHRKDYSVVNIHSNNVSLKATTHVESNQCDEEVDDRNVAISTEVLREKVIEEKKKFLINILRNKDCTEASVSSTLIKLSKGFIDETKYSKLQNTITLKLDRYSLLENESYSSDCSSLDNRVLALAFKVEAMMGDMIKELIVDAH